jgi:hypothetical protein
MFESSSVLGLKVNFSLKKPTGRRTGLPFKQRCPDVVPDPAGIEPAPLRLADGAKTHWARLAITART